jgi:pimeloyl-ACP methyl ester carboxylesterase
MEQPPALPTVKLHPANAYKQKPTRWPMAWNIETNNIATDGHREWRDHTIAVRDGLHLYARHYPAEDGTGKRRRAALCLPGLTRNSRDFHDLALNLSTGPNSRDVYTLDSRGRGASDYDTDWRNYTVPVEANDVIDALAALGLHDVALIGTSRGGLVAMVLAAMQPTSIGAVVLNDIGPIIERAGLSRISAYVGRTPTPISWDDATKMVRSISQQTFPAVPDEHWPSVARAWFNENKGRPAPGYDAKIGKAVSVVDGPPPPLWPQFDTLKAKPMLVIRGALSDILSAATVRAMQTRHPNCATLEVAGQGHAPLLKDAATCSKISTFLADADAGRSVAGQVL